MVFNLKTISLVFMLLMLNQGLHASSCYYVIKKGDTLTNILKDFGVEGIGRNRIRVMTASNFPTILKKGDLIYPKTVISIPYDQVNQNQQKCLHEGRREIIAAQQAECPPIETTPIDTTPMDTMPMDTMDEKNFEETSSEVKQASVGTKFKTTHAKKSTFRTNFSAGATWSRLDGTEKKNDTEGSFLNELSPNYSLDLAYRFSKRFEIILSGGLTYYLYEEAPSGNFINDTRFLADFYGLGLRYITDSWGKISLHIERRGELNYIIPVINNIEMSIDHVFPIRLEYEVDLLAKSSWDIYLSGKAEYFFGDVVEQGYGFQLGAKLGYQFLQSAIHLEAHWHQQSKESDFLEMEQKEIIASIQFSHFLNGGSY